MENTKAKKLLVVVLILLLLACLGVVAWQYIRLNSVDSIVANNTTSGTSQEENSKEENITVKPNKLEELVSELKTSKKSTVAGYETTLDMVVPKINVETDVTKKINSEIAAIQNKYIEAFKEDRVTKLNSINVVVSYKARIEENVLVLDITEKYSNYNGTGSSTGATTTTIKYDFVNDKRIYTLENLVVDDTFMENPLESDYETTLDMVLPRILVTTDVTKKINEEINVIYQKYLTAFLDHDRNQLNSRDVVVSYKANTEGNILVLDITEKYSNWNGTGSSTGATTTTIKYDFVKDKRIK